LKSHAIRQQTEQYAD